MPEHAPSPSYDLRTWFDPAWVPGAQPRWRPPRVAKMHLLLAGGGIIALLAGIGLLWPSRDAPKDRPFATAVPEARLDSRPAAPRVRTRSLPLRNLDELIPALRAAGFEQAAPAIEAAARTRFGPGAGEMRGLLRFTTASEGLLLDRLDITRADGITVRVTRGADGGFIGTRLEGIAARAVTIEGEMGDELYGSASDAGMPDSAISEFAAAFAYDFDFAREVQRNDVFEALIDRNVDAAGTPIGTPRLIFAKLQTRSKTLSLYRFTPPGGEQGWYDANGANVVRSFMRTPVEGGHVSSTFGMRFHPILNQLKSHNGVDFAVPKGTSVFAAADGRVEFFGLKGPNGKMVRLLHDKGWETLYLHLDSFAPGLTADMPIHQGELIGRVGTTGRSTGPHLHYEVHIAGKPVDPLSIPVETGKRLEGAALAAFIARRDKIDALRQP